MHSYINKNPSRFNLPEYTPGFTIEKAKKEAAEQFVDIKADRTYNLNKIREK